MVLMCIHPIMRKNQVGMDSIDRKSTRLNSSHSQISYAVFCLKKKKKHKVFAPLLERILRGVAFLSHCFAPHLEVSPSCANIAKYPSVHVRPIVFRAVAYAATL